MRFRQCAPYVAGAAVVAGMLTAPVAVASSNQAKPASPLQTVGHLAYLTKHQRVQVVTVKTTGKTTSATRIGPVTTPPAGRTIQIQGFVASSDGEWLAWLEVVAKSNGQPTRATPVLVMRDLTSAQVYRLQTDTFPVGFAGDQLVVSGDHTSRVELQPTPHLVRVPGNEYATAAYPDGVVDVKSTSAPAGPSETDRLRLTTFDGSHTVLYNYRLNPNDTRIPDLTVVSGDGKQLVVERGDHTDFGGIGPSSLVDEFSLSDGARTALGHYGTAKAAWRVGGVSFAWPSDDVWAVWERATKSGGATSVIALHRNGRWKSILSHGIAVAGNDDGYVVLQPGKYVFGSDGLQVTRVPTSDALLMHDTSTRVLGIQGSQFAWVTRPASS